MREEGGGRREEEEEEGVTAAGTEERREDCGTGNVCWYLGGTAGLGWDIYLISTVNTTQHKTTPGQVTSPGTRKLLETTKAGPSIIILTIFVL